MRKKMLFAVFSVMAILAIAVSPVYAITGNWVEDNEHPFVGLVVFYDANGDFIWRCSGTLLDPYTFLTAGHCADTEGGARRSSRSTRRSRTRRRGVRRA